MEIGQVINQQYQLIRSDDNASNKFDGVHVQTGARVMVELSSDPISPGVQFEEYQKFFLSFKNLQHTGLQKVVDAGVYQNYAYIVSEGPQGECISDRLKRGPYEVLEGLKLMRDLTEALQSANQVNLPHITIEPRSIWVNETGPFVTGLYEGVWQQFQQINCSFLIILIF